MKKIAAALICSLMVMFVLVGCTPSNPNTPSNPQPEQPAAVKNVIMMIGDGFGPNHLANAKKYFGIDEFIYEDNYICDVTTYSKDSNEEWATDSAASASALATGKKHYNGEVSRHEGEDIQSIMEIAQAQGKKTGIMTSDTLHGATPGAYSAHTNSRENKAEIVADQIQSGIDIMVGSAAEEYTNARQEFINAGYNYIDNVAAFDSLNPNQKYLGNVPALYANNQDYINYPALITKVLNYLDNEDGFFLMIENGLIDSYSHGNNFVSAMEEVVYFEAMIKAVYAFCEGRDDTVVLITADHETGNLALAEEEDISQWEDSKLNALYGWDRHSNMNVKLFIRFASLEDAKTYKDVIDNVDIFTLCQKLVVDESFDDTVIEQAA